MINTQFHCVDEGKRYFVVLDNGHQIFCGLEDECERFIEIHAEKVATQHEKEPPRDKRLAPIQERLKQGLSREDHVTDSLARGARGYDSKATGS